MTKFVRALVRFVKAEGGPTAVEYAVMLALVIVVCVVAITTLGQQTNETFSTTAEKLKAAGS
jgi:pilus assembly protein Flp/PilA